MRLTPACWGVRLLLAEALPGDGGSSICWAAFNTCGPCLPAGRPAGLLRVSPLCELVGCISAPATDVLDVLHACRLLGTLMPLQACQYALRRNPQLLAVNLPSRLAKLTRVLGKVLPGAPVDAVLGHRPALLLSPPARLVGKWRAVEQACALVPAWEVGLQELKSQAGCRPPEPEGQAAAQRAKRGKAKKRDQQQQGPAKLSEEQRRAVHQVARLLNTQAWQLPRLVFVGVAFPEQAPEEDVLELVSLPGENFNRRFPGFPEWRQARQAAAQQAAAVQELAVQEAGHAAGGSEEAAAATGQ